MPILAVELPYCEIRYDNLASICTSHTSRILISAHAFQWAHPRVAQPFAATSTRKDLALIGVRLTPHPHSKNKSEASDRLASRSREIRGFAESAGPRETNIRCEFPLNFVP